MKILYTNDKTTQLLIALLKGHGIRKVIVSPGTTNMCFVASLQYDPWFQLYSSVDERSAAYIACGLANESGEPVVITCTEATASRNYYPGLTEAYYRKLPILAITGYHNLDVIGHLHSQVIDRTQMVMDTVRLSVILKTCKTPNDEWINTVNINKAILALTHNGGGPAHINLQFPGNVGFDTKELPKVRIIKRITHETSFPTIEAKKIAIFVGSHKPWSDELTNAVNEFCKNNNAVVFCDQTSGYMGDYRIGYAIVSSQKYYKSKTNKPDLVIHIGEVSGDTYTQGYLKGSGQVWRVNEDGEIRDTFHNLTHVFQMSELYFFKHYSGKGNKGNTYLNECKNEIDDIRSKIGEYKFSNLWIAQQTALNLPPNSIIHLGIFNSLRSWNMTELSRSVKSYCNVGGFGIDGALSTTLGASLENPNKLYFCMCGDLAFFYDMNALGNRHFPANVRIMIINNGKGTEFRNFGHPAYPLGETANPYIAAAGHYGNKDKSPIKAYVESLGYKYLTAYNKEEFLENCKLFCESGSYNQPIVFEVFTETNDETESLQMLRTAEQETNIGIKTVAKKILGEEAISKIKDIIKK